jgi:hypothetical protein
LGEDGPDCFGNVRDRKRTRGGLSREEGGRKKEKIVNHEREE